jgi:hypothetical protein
MLHGDILVMPVPGIRRDRYALLLTDDNTRFVWLFTTKTRERLHLLIKKLLSLERKWKVIAGHSVAFNEQEMHAWHKSKTYQDEDRGNSKIIFFRKAGSNPARTEGRKISRARHLTKTKDPRRHEHRGPRSPRGRRRER